MHASNQYYATRLAPLPAMPTSDFMPRPMPSNKPGTSSFRSSLRKLPSSFFTSRDNANKENTERRLPPSPQIPVSSVDKPDAGKPRTRKGLGGFLGFGNSTSRGQKQAPHVPSKDHRLAHNEPSLMSKRDSAKSSASTASQSTLSLPHPQLATTQGRMSLGQDPFGREDLGAVVVHMVSRHGAAPSNRSSGTPSTSSVVHAVAPILHEQAQDGPLSVHERPSIAPISDVSSHIVAAAPTATIKSAVPRMMPNGSSSSIGATSTKTRPPPLPSPLRPSVVTERRSQQRLQRDRTKSRVWGFWAGGGNGKKTNKLKKKPSKASPLRNESYIKINLTHNDDEVKTRLQYSTSTRSPIEDPFAAPHPGPAPSMRPRPTPPALHISHPSYSMPDTATKHSVMASDTQHQRRSPSVTPTKMSIHRKPVPKVPFDEPSPSPNDIPTQPKPKAVHNAAPLSKIPVRPSEANATARTVPKRKSLTGLFGLKVKQSLDKLLPHGKEPIRNLRADSVAPKVALPKLKSFAEEMDLAFQRTVTLTPNSGEKSLRRAASATDRLLDLFKTFQFTPSPEFKTRRRDQRGTTDLLAGETQWESSPTPTRRNSMSLARKDVNTVATVQVVHPSKNTASGRKPGQRPDPNTVAAPLLPPRTTSLNVESRGAVIGTSSPAQPRFTRPATPGAKTKPVLHQPAANAHIDRAKLIKRITPPPEGVEAEAFARMFSDIPFELQKLICPELVEPPAAVVESRLRGLPPPPRSDRNAPRRNARAAPAISLPPPPDEFATPRDRRGLSRETPDVPKIATQWTPAPLPVSQSGSAFVLSESMGQNGEFDFAEEVAWINDGNNRASFVETVQAVADCAAYELDPSPAPAVLSDSPLRAPRPLSTIEQSPDAKSESSGNRLGSANSPSNHGPVDTEDGFLDADEVDVSQPVYILPVTSGRCGGTPQRKAPFQGQFAFQQHVSKMADAATSTLFQDSRERDLSLPATAPPVAGRQRTHRRDESGFSIATISSIGAVIDGIAGEYTNHFEVNFADYMASSHSIAQCNYTSRRLPEDTATPLDDLSTVTLEREVHASAVHSTRSDGQRHRTTSVVSIDSIKAEVDEMLARPPVSLHNKNRPSHTQRHGRAGSRESSWGRADWAAHRRDDCLDSVGSVLSASRLVRPGLGDRMFQVQSDDASILPRSQSRASTADSMFDTANNDTYDSMFDAAEQSFNSMFDTQEAITTNSGSFFSPPARTTARSSSLDAEFVLKTRPVSDLSTVSGDSADDAELDPSKYAAKMATKRSVNCLQAHGELGAADEVALGRIAGSTRPELDASLARHSKPVGARHRKPGRLVFNDNANMPTPGLASPSTSDVSSRFSLLSRLSDAPTSYGWSGKHTKPWGHTRQKSSLAYELGTFARNESSQAAQRAEAARADTVPGPTVENKSSQRALRPEPMVVSWDEESHPSTVNSWLHLQREAEAICNRDKGIELRESTDSPNSPMTKEALAAFLAQSKDLYRPLDQLPLGERMTHKKKASFSASRTTFSPYGLPVTNARRKSPAAVETEHCVFERSESTRQLDCGANLGNATDSAKVTLLDRPVPSNLPANETRIPVSSRRNPDLQVAIPRDADAFGLREISQAAANARAGSLAPPSAVSKKPLSFAAPPSAEKTDPIGRKRLSSEDRRVALGWGRRRNSDGPSQKIPQDGRQRDAPVSKLPVPPRTATGATFPTAPTKSLASGMKENAYVLAGPRLLVTRGQPSARLSNRTPSRVRPVLRA